MGCVESPRPQQARAGNVFRGPRQALVDDSDLCFINLSVISRVKRDLVEEIQVLVRTDK